MKNTITLCILVLLGACTSGGKKATANSYYRFPENTIQPLTHLNIDVKRPSALGILGNRPMVAQTDDAGLIQMSHNFWLDSPKVLLHNYLSEIFDLNTQDAVLTLNSQIKALEKKQDNALLSIHFTVTDANNQTVFAQTYKNQKPLANNSIPEFATTIALLLEQMVLQFAQDLQKLP